MTYITAKISLSAAIIAWVAPSEVAMAGICYSMPAPLALTAAGEGTTICAMAVCTCPARSVIADTSLPRSLVNTVAEAFAREIPT